MATGYHDFTAGETLTAANLEDYCEKQSVMVFASAAARNAALAAVLQEGMCAFLLDANSLTVYTGAAWSTVGPVHGALTPFDPVITQLGGVSHTVSASTWWRVGRLVNWRWVLTCTGSGTAANLVTLSLPVNVAYVSDFAPLGHFQVYDTSANLNYSGPACPAAAGTIKGYSVYPAATLAPVFMGAGGGFTAALATGDILSGWVTYEAAADG